MLHTHGPWTARYDGDSRASIHAPRPGWQEGQFVLARVEGFSPAATQADAYLIAAAPYLLAVCETIYRAVEDICLPGAVYLSIAERDQLRAAIAAVTGETP